MARPRLTREQILGHRAHAQGLDRRPGGAAAVRRLGVQDTPYGSARAALAQRSEFSADDHDHGDVLVWSWRGAPHLQLTDGLSALAQALWPLNDADATARISTGAIRQGARRGIEAFTATAEAMRAAVTGRSSKGEVSAAVSAAIPEDLTFDCQSCRARHVSGALFQAVGLAAGARVVPEGRQTFLEPLPDPVRPPGVPTDAHGTAEALRRYVEVLAPATTAHLASFLGTSHAVLRTLPLDGLVEVDGPDGAGWVREEDLEAMRRACSPTGVVLLPPSDPWLQARDRDLILPGKTRQSQVWKALNSPGAVLVDGELVGTWRAKATGRRLVLTVTPFDRLPALAAGELEAPSHAIAVARGATSASVVVAG